LRLEMMRAQVHSFRPYDSGKQLHARSSGRNLLPLRTRH
jgi:hypothetical protein